MLITTNGRVTSVSTYGLRHILACPDFRQNHHYERGASSSKPSLKLPQGFLEEQEGEKEVGCEQPYFLAAGEW